jgi:hypothetical protein
VNTLRKFLFAAIAGLLWVAPTYGQNAQPRGGAKPPAPTTEAADGTLGMALLAAAIVGTTGATSRGSGVTSSARLAAGQYEVIFDRNVTACFYNATQADLGILIPPPGFIGVAPRAGNVNGVFVVTTNSAGTNTDRTFMLQVFCAR